MASVPLGSVTLEMVRAAGGINVGAPGNEICWVLRRNRRLAPMYAFDSPAEVMPEDLLIEVEVLNRTEFERVRDQLIALGVNGPWEKGEWTATTES